MLILFTAAPGHHTNPGHRNAKFPNLSLLLLAFAPPTLKWQTFGRARRRMSSAITKVTEENSSLVAQFACGWLALKPQTRLTILFTVPSLPTYTIFRALFYVILLSAMVSLTIVTIVTTTTEREC